MEHLTKDEATNFFSELFYGEHHIPSEVKQYGQGFAITTNRGNFATTDFNNLTRLVLMAHEKCIRAEITGSNKFGSITIAIWKRQREGGISQSHPTIEQAIEKYRNAVLAVTA
jgi:hypothetical protein